MGYKSPRTYTICGMAGTTVNPLDATTYYLGGSIPSLATSGASRRIIIPENGIVRQIFLSTYCGTADGTNEDWTFSLTDGTTTTAIQTLGLTQANRVFYNNNLNYKVTKGGYIQFVTLTPTWATNPEGFCAHWVIVIEYE